MTISDNLPQNEWNEKGAAYAQSIKEMIAFGETHGWDAWKGEEPKDERDHLGARVVELLKEANRNGTTNEFRERFPPAHAPLIATLQEEGQSIENLCFISDDNIAFVVGTAYQQREAYVLMGRTAERLTGDIRAIGKSHRNEIFAIAEGKFVTTYKGWYGSVIARFPLPQTDDLPITSIVPFNDGLRVLLVSSAGIYLLEPCSHAMIHPVADPDDAEWSSNIDMEHAAISPDNGLIAVGDQGSDHRILDADGNEVAQIGPQSSYPHYALFAKDGSQAVLNSCHFYNGITVGVPTAGIQGLKIEPYTEDDRYTVVEDGSRVYTGVADSEGYIFGDAYGYIRAVDNSGNKRWNYFLGSTISGMAISDDEQSLWVASSSGMIHKLKLHAGQRDLHTIGNGDHYEEFRMIFWKSEAGPLIW